MSRMADLDIAMDRAIEDFAEAIGLGFVARADLKLAMKARPWAALKALQALAEAFGEIP